jgi:TolA-binding protein
LTICTSSAIAQSADGQDEICRSVEDAQGETQRLKECDLDRRELQLLRDQIKNKDDKIATLEEKVRLKTEEGLIKDQMAAVKDQMIANQQKNFDQLKEVTDRAIKLAETKKSSLWETWGPLAAIAIIVVTIATIL